MNSSETMSQRPSGCLCITCNAQLSRVEQVITRPTAGSLRAQFQAAISCEDGSVDATLTGVMSESHRRRGRLDIHARAG